MEPHPTEFHQLGQSELRVIRLFPVDPLLIIFEFGLLAQETVVKTIAFLLEIFQFQRRTAVLRILPRYLRLR